MKERAEHLIGYVFGLLAALVDDYTLITLAIFVGLLGWLTGSVLIAATAFFGLYFLMRLVNFIGEGLAWHGQAAAEAGRQQAQATMQIAAAIAQTQRVHGQVQDD